MSRPLLAGLVLAYAVGQQTTSLRCLLPGGPPACIDAWRPELDEADAFVLGIVQGDAEDCALRAQERQSESAFDTLPNTEEATCGIPALLSYEMLHIAWSFRRACLQSFPDPGLPCSATAVQTEVEMLLLGLPGLPTEASLPLGITEVIFGCVGDFNARASALLTRHLGAMARHADPNTLYRALLEVSSGLGFERRLLQWRANVMVAVNEYGLASYAPQIELSDRFFGSRVEVLAHLLGENLPKTFVEVGVHMGRLAFALMSIRPRVRYIGVDPYVYDGSLTSAASIDKQLRDLGHDGLQDAAGLAKEARLAAEAKFHYFGDRASLWVNSSAEGAQQCPDGSVDGIFIDGDHSYIAVVEDLEAWERKLRPGGFLAGHDFGNSPDVARAVLERAYRRKRTVHLAMDWVWYWHV